ncbi:RluA family pseudouridine synthase [Brevibacillus humidisoli]|uniref:RluA family pseudouridine synthase n=1 Tax=Brevibacillus humidisoli TaxID=2895522 RepID=UPI001E47EF7C|nr:RluA family pseudouridine synthase [Brevibacillus humidisoli]UFJ42701.1 RluA family pseudouridine synthase [Brevibacillus humidisoli]
MIIMDRQEEWLTGTLPGQVPAVTVGQLLREHWKLPKKTVHLLFQGKGVRINGEVVNQLQKIQPGDAVSLWACQPEPLGLEPRRGDLAILYEDEHLLIVNKRAGCLLHPTPSNLDVTLDHLVAGYFAEKGIEAKVRHVHRLDRETSGAVLYAKHALAAALLDERLRRREISRRYVAFVHGQPKQESGTIKAPIGRDRHHAVRRIVTSGGEQAITHYRILDRYRGGAQVECILDTGKTHQIRVHFRHLGHPLMGDVLYGGKTGLIDRVALHAASLQLNHPFGEHRVIVEANWPDDLLQLHDRLGSG